MDMAFITVSTSFVEKSALALGLGKKGATALGLATEEIFAYLCRNSGSDQEIEIRCLDGNYYIQAEFSCSLKGINLRFFNITASVSPDDEESLEQMGLLIASRFVDRLQVQERPGQGILLTLVKEKSYPPVQGDVPPISSPLSRFSIVRPEPEVLKIFARKVHLCYPGWLLPQFFTFPGKLVDMAAAGEYEAALALGAQGQVGGGMIWYWASRKTVGCFGPYVFGQNPDSSMPEALLEACIAAIGKTYAVGLVNSFPTKQLPREHFEMLGTLTLFDEHGSGTPVTACFRQMQEDPGSSSWCHPDMAPFLREQYDRLVLPRELMPVKDQGETGNPFSVLSARFDRAQKRVTLQPILSGKDAEKNIADHLKLFRKEGFHNIFFEMDLGNPWHTHFTPGLLRNGFTPRIVIPYGGDGDRIVFQFEA
jgi:anti-sigma regulatory factor (Ser/Thr protein kinase)